MLQIIALCSPCSLPIRFPHSGSDLLKKHKHDSATFLLKPLSILPITLELKTKMLHVT